MPRKGKCGGEVKGGDRQPREPAQTEQPSVPDKCRCTETPGAQTAHVLSRAIQPERAECISQCARSQHDAGAPGSEYQVQPDPNVPVKIPEVPRPAPSRAKETSTAQVPTRVSFRDADARSINGTKRSKFRPASVNQGPPRVSS